MTIDITLSAPTFKALGQPTGVEAYVTITNGPEAIDAGQIVLGILGTSPDTSQQMGSNQFPLGAFAAAESRQVDGGIQLDPGTWELTMMIYDAQGSQVAQTSPESFTIEGPKHHSEQFADSSQLQFTIEPTSVHHDQEFLVKVEYHLHNTGTVAILPGFPVDITLTDADGNVSGQIYEIEQGVPKGGSEPKFLHVESGADKAGTTSKLRMIGDVGGQAEKEFNFTLTWKEGGTADVAPA